MSMFPVIEWTGSGSQTSDTTTHTISVPSTINVGDRVLVFFAMDNNSSSQLQSTSTGAGLTLLYEGGRLYEAGKPNLYYIDLIATIQNSGTLSLITNVAEKSSHITYRISGVVDYISILVNNFECNVADYVGTSTDADPPAVNTDSIKTLGTQDFLFFAVSAFLGTVTASAAPTDFSGLTSVTNSGADGASISSSYRQYRSSGSYNPGAFTSASTSWVTFTAAICPKLYVGLPFYPNLVS